METRTNSRKNSDAPDRDSQNQIEVERVLDLPILKVWKALSDAETLKKWWGPQDYTCPFSSINFKAGGKYLHCMRSSSGEEIWSTGVFNEIIPTKKIVMTDSFSDSKGNVIAASEHDMPGDWPLELLITITLTEKNGKTELKLEHEGIPDEMYEDCIQGWNSSFDKMERKLK